MNTRQTLKLAMEAAAGGRLATVRAFHFCPAGFDDGDDEPSHRGCPLDLFLQLTVTQCRGGTLAVQVQLAISPTAAEALARDLGRLAAELYVAGKLALGGAQ